MSDGRFWLVWRDGGASPIAKHASRSSAFTEANRLAKANPGTRFVVLEAIADAIATIQVNGRTLEGHHPWTAASSPALEPKVPTILGPAPATFQPITGAGGWPPIVARPVPAPGAAFDCPPAPAVGYDYRPQRAPADA